MAWDEGLREVYLWLEMIAFCLLQIDVLDSLWFIVRVADFTNQEPYLGPGFDLCRT